MVDIDLGMLTDFTITCSEPICSCKAQAVQWNIIGHKSGFALHLWCKTCDTDLKIPSSQIAASINFEKPYQTILKVVESVTPADGKVIHVDFSK